MFSRIKQKQLVFEKSSRLYKGHRYFRLDMHILKFFHMLFTTMKVFDILCEMGIF